MQRELRPYKGSCHCGAVKIEAQTTLSLTLRCNCSLCKRKDTVMAAVDPLSLEVGLHDGASLA